MMKWLNEIPVINVEDLLENLNYKLVIFYICFTIFALWAFWFIFWGISALWMFSGLLIGGTFNSEFFFFHLAHLIRFALPALLSYLVCVHLN